MYQCSSTGEDVVNEFDSLVSIFTDSATEMKKLVEMLRCDRKKPLPSSLPHLSLSAL